MTRSEWQLLHSWSQEVLCARPESQKKHITAIFLDASSLEIVVSSKLLTANRRMMPWSWVLRGFPLRFLSTNNFVAKSITMQFLFQIFYNFLSATIWERFVQLRSPIPRRRWVLFLAPFKPTVAQDLRSSLQIFTTCTSLSSQTSAASLCSYFWANADKFYISSFNVSSSSRCCA